MTRTGTRYHVAVVDGPDVGWVMPVPAVGEAILGRALDAHASIADPRLSRQHLAVRARRGHVQVRTLGRARARVRRAHARADQPPRLGRARRVARRWQEVSVASEIRVGGTILAVRDHPGLAPAPRRIERLDLGDGLGMRLLIPVAMAASMIPLALSGTGTSPWRALVWLVLPLALVVSVLWPWMRARGRRGSRPQETPPVPAPDPAAALWLAAHPWRDRPPVWDVGGGADRTPKRELERPQAGTGVAIVGPRPATAALARWLVCQNAVTVAPQDLAIEVPTGWDWAATLPHRTSHAELRLTVMDHHEPGARVAAPDGIAVVMAGALSEVPAWCGRVIEVACGHDRSVSVDWAAEIAQTLRRTDEPDGGLPAVIDLRSLLGVADVADVLDAWNGAGARDQNAGLRTIIGMGTNGEPVGLDLAAEGPHALVAGTTGSGKSELLITWVLGLAMRHPPSDLTVLLIDYKGGATFGALAPVPHVVDVLTDLEPTATTRALASLRAELARREQLLARAGARTLEEFRLTKPPTPPRAPTTDHLPRLLVMVDEFRAMADAHPELLDSLVRLAAQGRSLGIHLVLATQRPGGAITADMRANISVRLCLRTLEDTDSIDMIGDARAARLPAVPGRAILRTEHSQTLQVAWPGPLETGVRTAVEALVDAAARTGGPAPSPLWAPPLPRRLAVTELPEAAGSLRLLRTDLPHEQRWGCWALPIGESLLISGPPRSGRTCALRTLAAEAARAGLVVHAIAADDLGAHAPSRGTWCPPRDHRRVHRLLMRLTGGDQHGQILLIDDVTGLCTSLDERLGIGAAVDLLAELIRESRRCGLSLVLTADSPAGRWASSIAAHLVLAPRDASDAVISGAPRELAGGGWPPGRGILLADADAVIGHVAADDGARSSTPPVRPPLRIRELPAHVDLPIADGTGPAGILLGHGGDEGAPVWADIGAGSTWLICGPPGSGRSTTLRMIAARLSHAGVPVAGPGLPDGGSPAVVVLDDADRADAASVASVSAALEGGAALVAVADPERLISSYTEPARRLREPDVVIAISSAPPGPVPPAVRTLVESIRGRAILHGDGRIESLQLDRCSQADGYAVSSGADAGRLVAATELGRSRPTTTRTEEASTG